MSKASVRISLTNVIGLGATTLAESLLPELERLDDLAVEMIYLPDRGELAGFGRTLRSPSTVYKRRLPKSLSRVLECTLLGGRFDGASPLVIMGDLPLATEAVQIVFVQNTHVIDDNSPPGLSDQLRFRVARAIFRRNKRRVAAFVVQSSAMRDKLVDGHAIDPAIIHVIAQPPPEWLLASGLKRTAAVRDKGAALRFFYPAAPYPHKNHALLGAFASDPDWQQRVESVVLTIDPAEVPFTAPWMRCVGQLSSTAMIAAYRDTDALLFLSKTESFGFPLVEAMTIGLPIICPDLAYARALCGDTALYFDIDRPATLTEAITTLQQRLDGGWWPDWQPQLAALPRDWRAVARALEKVVLSVGGGGR